jgi:hypothetical protein
MPQNVGVKALQTDVLFAAVLPKAQKEMWDGGLAGKR